MSNEPETNDTSYTDESGHTNAGNQYDHPDQDVVGTDITSGEGNDVEPDSEPKQPAPAPAPAPAPEPPPEEPPAP